MPPPFRPKLARYGNICCEQVMPAPVIPVCAVSCSIPVPIVTVSNLTTPLFPPGYTPIPAQPTSGSCATC
jgi:hypothetical protein